MNTRLVIAFQMLAITLVCVACGGSADKATKRFAVVFSSVSDDGTPVGKTRFALGKTVLGMTDDRGRLEKSLTGKEGQTAALSVSCPEGFMAPEEAPLLSLREVRKVNQDAPATLNVAVTCDRKQRDVLVVVRTSNASALPVDIAGKTVGATSADGTAHFHVSLGRDVRSLSVALQTEELPTLRPRNPSRVFELDGRDAVLLVEQSFTSERIVRSKRTGPSGYVAPKKRIPQRIDSTRFHAL